MKDTLPRVLFPLSYHFNSPSIATKLKAKFKGFFNSQIYFTQYCLLVLYLNYKQTNYENKILYFSCFLSHLKLGTFSKLSCNDKV